MINMSQAELKLIALGCHFSEGGKVSNPSPLPKFLPILIHFNLRGFPTHLFFLSVCSRTTSKSPNTVVTPRVQRRSCTARPSANSPTPGLSRAMLALQPLPLGPKTQAPTPRLPLEKPKPPRLLEAVLIPARSARTLLVVLVVSRIRTLHPPATPRLHSLLALRVSTKMPWQWKLQPKSPRKLLRSSPFREFSPYISKKLFFI